MADEITRTKNELEMKSSASTKISSSKIYSIKKSKSK